MARLYRFAAASALAAGLSLAAAPAAAQGYYHYGHHHHGVDGGDVLAGAAIIGGIAAIASVAGHHDHGYSAPPPGAYGHPGYGGPGLARAVGTCAAVVERGTGPISAIDTVSRDPNGWWVSGVLAGGAGFTCLAGLDGRVLSVNVGGPGPGPGGPGAGAAPPAGPALAPPPGDGNYDQRSPRGENDGDLPPTADNRPVWRDQPQAPDDGRYATSQAPDFGQGV
jgi:hypothetical protein